MLMLSGGGGDDDDDDDGDVRRNIPVGWFGR
jgi:hypothetical protein